MTARSPRRSGLRHWLPLLLAAGCLLGPACLPEVSRGGTGIARAQDEPKRPDDGRGREGREGREGRDGGDREGGNTSGPRGSESPDAPKNAPGAADAQVQGGKRQAEGGAGLLLPVLLSALVAALVSAAMFFLLPRLLGRSAAGAGAGAPSASGAALSASPAPPPQWPDYNQFHTGVVGLLQQAAGVKQAPGQQAIETWRRSLARLKGELDRAPVGPGDTAALRATAAEVNRLQNEIGQRAAKGMPALRALRPEIESLQDSLRFKLDAAGSPGPGQPAAAPAPAAGAALTREQFAEMLQDEAGDWLNRLKEEVQDQRAALETLSGRLQEKAERRELTELQAAVRRAAERPATLGELLQGEFRALCESRAAELAAEIQRRQPSAARAQAPPPPVVSGALALAQAALKVTAEASSDPKLSPAVSSQLINLGTLAQHLRQMNPVAAETPEAPPTVDAIRRLPEEPEAQWKPDSVARAGA